jgi:hypothetical protein
VCGFFSRTFDVVAVTPDIEWASKDEDPLLQRIRMQYTLTPKLVNRGGGADGKNTTHQKKYVFERCVETQFDYEQSTDGSVSPTLDLVAPDWIRVVHSLYRVSEGGKPAGRSPQGLACVKRVVYIMQR